MDSSILLGRLIGPFIIVIGFGVLFNAKIFKQIVEDFFKNSGLLYISGLIAFCSGLAIVLFHNIWSFDWRLIITLFGWLTLIKGTLLIVVPDIMTKMSKAYFKNVNVIRIPWTIMIAVGILLIAKSY